MKTKTCMLAMASILMAGSAHAAFLVSGTGPGSTYKNGYAEPIVEAASPITEEALYGKVENRDGKGTLDNLRVCANTTDDICLGIGQGNLVAKSEQVKSGDVCIIRADLEPEFTFLFSDNSRLTDWGAIRENWGAGRITIYTSSTSSGSIGTLNEVKEATGFEDAKIEALDSWDAVIREVKQNPRAVGFTHRYADPSGFLSTLVDEHNLTVTGLAELSLRRVTHANGQPVYTVSMNVPYDTEGVMGLGGVATTPSMGTPVVLFGTCPSKFGGEAQYVREVYDEIASIPADKLKVELGTISKIINAVAGKSESVGADRGWEFFDSMVERGGALIE